MGTNIFVNEGHYCWVDIQKLLNNEQRVRDVGPLVANINWKL